MRRIRRPQLALIALLLALVIGYAVEALGSHHPGPARPTPGAPATGSASSQGMPLPGLTPRAADYTSDHYENFVRTDVTR